jgi:hypothetical protein
LEEYGYLKIIMETDVNMLHAGFLLGLFCDPKDGGHMFL